jgi:hypothetical protein
MIPRFASTTKPVAVEEDAAWVSKARGAAARITTTAGTMRSRVLSQESVGAAAASAEAASSHSMEAG